MIYKPKDPLNDPYKYKRENKSQNGFFVGLSLAAMWLLFIIWIFNRTWGEYFGEIPMVVQLVMIIFFIIVALIYYLLLRKQNN